MLSDSLKATVPYSLMSKTRAPMSRSQLATLASCYSRNLLAREAMAIYLQRLRGPWSVIAFHVSNRSIDLRPVVAALAREYHLASLEIVTASVSDWILVSGDPAVLGIPVLAANGHPIELTHPPVLWTDDYSNLYSLLTSW